ncbi:hypothetical protein PMIN06_012368 [Paraphaeosphaeria minitans]|uniref:Dilute domain-containing protein C25B8.08 n=1 Tax=Paraphaeosphaeria minitans TaxID=565426 RepID=A0A9P6KP65_9PLEO|nr:Dilute domain-containing protein C25B8.08 [Paraphaeosphaeria minitans]
MDSDQEHAYSGDDPQSVPLPRQLPADLPTSLDDRRTPHLPADDMEIYDAWQGQSQFLTNPMPAQPLTFNLSLDDPSFGDEDMQQLEDSDSRLVQMLAHQARLKNDNSGDEAKVVADDKLSYEEKQQALQGLFTLAASNGEMQRVKRLLDGKAREYIDMDGVDAEGTPPLVYASCFGHEDIAETLLKEGAKVDVQDKNLWTPLIWAMTNRHKGIVKLLLENGASPDHKSSGGRTAFDFVEPNSEISDYLHDAGYTIGNAGVTEDFYSSGFSQDRFEQEMQENDMKRRMMMESAFNLEVDLGNLGLDEQPESPGELEEESQDFVWDRCLNDQMFVFQENELDRILDIIITNMTPQRSPSQKPIPANILFLSARYAHYHSGTELLEILLSSAMEKINLIVEKHQWDMTVLAFWISNATLLLHYLKKDTGLATATGVFQLQLSELINEIFILIIRDAERRMDKVLDQAMLDHEPMPGFEDIQFQNEWKIFKTKQKAKPVEPFEKRFRPPSPKQRMKPSARNITSLLSSTLFVLDLYDIHSVITAQILSQLIYWLCAELFNRIMSNRKYLARTKAMQIRMNVSTIEEWIRSNNRQPEHYENGSMTSTGETTAESAKRHLEPLIQLLQWLQCFSSIGDDLEDLKSTIDQLTRLSPQQQLHAAKYYRVEVGEKGITKSARNHITGLQKAAAERRAARGRSPNPSQRAPVSTPSTPIKATMQPIPAPSPAPSRVSEDEQERDAPDELLFDPSYMLPFHLPTSTDMLIMYGAGFGGVNKERERKYIPTVPPEFLTKLDLSGGNNGTSLYDETKWESQGYR